jgi:hypothetical protein
MGAADAASSIPIAQRPSILKELRSQGPTLSSLACGTRCLQQGAMRCLVLPTASGAAAQVPVVGSLRTARLRWQDRKRPAAPRY